MPPVHRITHLSTLDSGGGAERVALRLVEAQRRHGLDAHLLAGKKLLDAPYTHEFPLDPIPSDRLLASEYQYYHLMGSHRLVHHPLVRGADVLHLHNLHGGYFNPFSLLPLAQTRPVVWTLHDMHAFTGHCAHAFDCERWQEGCGGCPALDTYPAIPFDQSRSLWADKRLVSEAVDLRLVTPSLWLKRKVERSFLGRHRVDHIPNGVDTRVFRPLDRGEMRRRLDLPPDAILIGGVANGGVLANPWKGGRFVLETIAALQESHPDAWFVNIGAHARSEHPRVIDLPRVTDEGQLAALFSMLDVYLFPSIAENFPLVTLEAMACGIPVVAFATGGVPEQIRDGQDGVIAPYGDGEALIDGLRRLLANSEARTRFGRSARERAEREFDHRRIEDRYLAAYAETAAGHGAAGRSPSMLVPDWVRKAQEGRSAGMLSGAEGLLRLALELDPDHGAAVLALSELLAENGLLEEALRLLESAARRMVGDREVWKHLGVYRFHAGNAPGAMDALLRAQELDPGDLDTLISLGDMALGEGQDQRAREWFQQACDAHPDETDAWAGLAMACRRLRENRALALAQERLRVLAPDHPALKP